MSKNFNDLVAKASSGKKRILSVSVAQDKPVLEAVKIAKEKGICDAILVGDEAKIREIAASIDMNLDDYRIVNEPDTDAAAITAVKLVHDHEADILMKGLLETKTFLKSVLNKEVGLRGHKMMSHVCVFEVKGIDRLLFFTDVAFNTYPTLEDKAVIIENCVELAHACGIETPKVAPLCAVEVVNPKMQPTVDAQALTEMNKNGEITGCEVYGPLSMDLAIDPEAAVHKGISNPVAGNADILLFPNIDAGNITYKMLVRTGIAKNGNLLVGTTAPVILTSRSDDTEVKVNSIALAACVASAVTE
jgi:phosphate butyryltransferase